MLQPPVGIVGRANGPDYTLMRSRIYTHTHTHTHTHPDVMSLYLRVSREELGGGSSGGAGGGRGGGSGLRAPIDKIATSAANVAFAALWRNWVIGNFFFPTATSRFDLKKHKGSQSILSLFN